MINKRTSDSTTKASIFAAIALTFSNAVSAVSFADPNTFDHINDYEDAYVFADNYVGGSGGDAFDDKGSIENENPWIKPVRVEIRHGNRIDKITIAYGYNEPTSEFDTSHGGGGGSSDTLYLADDKFIEKIKICSTDSNSGKGRIGKIEITTTGNNTSTYGNTCKSSRTFTAPTGWHIIGFKGRSGGEVDRLQPLYALKLKIETSIVIGQPVESNPQVIGASRDAIFNDNSTPLSSTLSYSETYGEVRTTSWKNTATFSLGYSLTLATELGMMGPASGSISTSQTYSSTFTDSFEYGKTSTENTAGTNSTQKQYSADPRTVVVASVTNSRTDAVAPLEIKYRNIYTNTVHRSDGAVDSFSTNQSSMSSTNVGYFDGNNKIVLYAAFANHPIYSCFAGKYAWQAESYCPI